MSGRLIVSCTIALAFALAGCSATPRAQSRKLVPATAKLVASGEPTIAHFTEGGVTLYVVDETSNSLVFSGQIPANANIVVRVDRGATAIVAEGPSPRDENKQTVLAKPIDKSHRFSMWTDGQASTSAASATRSVEISE